QVIAYMGQGTLGRAVVSEVLGVADRSLLVELGRAVVARDVATTLRTLAAAAERGLDLGQLARAFLATSSTPRPRSWPSCRSWRARRPLRRAAGPRTWSRCSSIGGRAPST